MKVDSFSDSCLQKMRNRVKKLEVLAKYFEGDEKENLYYLQNTTKPPATFVKNLSLSVLVSMIIKNTYKGASEKLGVSVAFLKSCMDSYDIEGVIIDTKSDFISEKYSLQQLVELSKEIEYVSLVSAVSGWSESAIRKALGRKGIDLKSEHTTSRGRRAELFYKKLRGSNIVRDLNEDDPRSVYDFDDREFGAVNVRSVKPYMTKGGKKKWYFKTKSNGEEAFAFVGYDELGERVEFVYLVRSDQFKEGHKGLLIEEGKYPSEEYSRLYPIK